MTKSNSTSSRFEPIKLNKSYESASHDPSSSFRHGGYPSVNGSSSSSSSSSSPSSSSSSFRHGGLVSISRSSVSVRSQPSSSSSSSSSRSSSFKLSIPRPVNLPSLRREQSGNDPAIALVGGASGSSGWSKKQQNSAPSTDISSSLADNDNSVSIKYSSWNSSFQRRNSGTNPASLEENGSRYTPPGPAVVRGEDFPTLQASSAAYPHHRKEAQPKQKDKQLEIEDNKLKQRDKRQDDEDRRPIQLQEHCKDELLGRKGYSSRKEILGKDNELLPHQSGPKLQTVSTKPRSKQPFNDEEYCYGDRDDTIHKSGRYKACDDMTGKTQSYKDPDDTIGKISSSEGCDDAISKSSIHKYNVGAISRSSCYEARDNTVGKPSHHDALSKTINHRFAGPSPLVRLTHSSSNWIDDERETLGSSRSEGMGRVDHLALTRSTSMNSFSNRLSRGPTNLTSPSFTRNEPTDDVRKDFRTPQGNADYGRRFMKDIGFREDRVGPDLHINESSNLNQNIGRKEFARRGLSSSLNDVSTTRNTRFASGSSFNNRSTNGYGLDLGLNSFRSDVNSSNNFGMNSTKREVSSQDIGLKKDYFLNKNNSDRGQRRSNGSHQFGRSSVNVVSTSYSGPRDDFPGLIYGRQEKTHGMYKQDSFFDDSGNSQINSFFGVDSLVGSSSLGARIFRKKKDEPINYNDPAREQFEAELERVQKLQEQERQRIIEEREKAIELAIKEAEEQERLAREEELFRVKLEEEARETAAKAQRQIEEAARKAEEVRRVREEEKHMAIFEEERRKEAARRKLMELEERIFKRESMQKHRDSFVFERARNAVNDEKEDEVRHKVDCATFNGASPLTSPRREDREVMDNLNSQPRFPSLERDRVVQMNRRVNVDGGLGLSSISSKIDPFNHHPSQLVHELGSKSFSLKNSTTGLLRGPLNDSKQSEPITRKQQRWESSQTEGLSGRNLSSDINTGYMGDPKDRSGDGWWGGENRHKLQEKRLTSPPLSHYLNGGETDYPIVGRLRQSLPKQPRVPPPIFSHGLATLQRKVAQTESSHISAAMDGRNNSESLVEDIDIHEYALKTEPQCRSLSSIESLSESSGSAVSTEISLLPNGKLQVSDYVLENKIVCLSEDYQGLPSDEDDAISELTDSIKRLGDGATQMGAGIMEEKKDAASADDAWLEQTIEADSSSLHLHNSPKVETIDEPDNEEWENVDALIVKRSEQEHVTEDSEENHPSDQVDEIENGVLYEPEKPIDCEWNRDAVYIPEYEAPIEATLEDQTLEDTTTNQAPLQQHMFSAPTISDSMQMGPAEGVNLNKSLFQQFQQPFSFMAVPLPQSTTLNSVAPHQAMLHSPHSQQELSYHPQISVVSNIPNAIQIGSIQMPLQVHSQVTQLTHLHQQPPVFQFGQICHSVPFNQPITSLQTSDRFHHVVDQPLNHHIESLAAVLDGSLGSSLSHQVVDEEAIGENDIVVETCTPVEASISVETEGRVLGSEEQNVCEFLTSETNLQDSVELETSLALESGNADTSVNQSSSVDRPGSRRRNNHSTDYGTFGRGRGRFHTGNGFKGPYSISQTWIENGEEEAVHKRIPKRNIQRTEYRARKPLPDIDGNHGADMNEERNLMSHDHGSIELNTANIHTSIKRKPNIHAQESSAYLHSATLSHSDMQNNRTLQDSFPTLVGSTNTSVDGQMNSLQSKGISKYDAAEEIMFEEPDAETYKDKDDFIEVRSKRQMLREQRELRDKEKARDFKVKEQIRRKPQKLAAKEAAIADKTANEHWATPNTDLMKYEMHTKPSSSVSLDSSLLQLSATCSPVGTSTVEIYDDINQNMKIVMSGQVQSTANASHTNIGSTKIYGHQSYGDVAVHSTYNVKNVNTAWGGQRFPHEVVSLTQIQLEEAMKPIRFEGISSQVTPIMEGGLATTGPGVTVASGPVNASLSVPNPISSLLAGEKIQFGAVTSPTVISCDNLPSSPSFMGTVSKPSSYAVDAGSNVTINHLNYTRSFMAPDKNTGFALPTTENNEYSEVVDAEAEAEAAASAVAVAAISSDETAGNHSDANAIIGGGPHANRFSSFTNSSGIDVQRPAMIQAPAKSTGIEDSISATLPADLSVEAPSTLMSGSMSGTAGFMLANFPNRVSPFPCLEMGTILGGSIFTFGHREEAPTAPLQDGSIAGWQQMQSSTSDSFYGPPQFMSPTGITNIQGHPHMLVYTNPLTPVGQFGPLGVSFMGTAYHPSGKQPDWTHTPFTSPLASSYPDTGDMDAGFSSMIDLQHSATTSNSVQAFSVAGCSMMPMATPISLFDPNISTPFQAQWSRPPASPFPNYPFSGQAQSRGLNSHPGEYGLIHQPFHMDYNTHHHHHHHHQSLDASSSPFLPGDVTSVPAIHFPDELGLGYSITAVNVPPNNVNLSSQAIKGDNSLSLGEEKRTTPPTSTR